MWGVLQMNSTKLPKIILFDLDGVILDTESIYLELMVEYNKNVNMPITRKFYINNFLGRTKKDINSYYEKKYKEMFDKYSSLQREVFETILGWSNKIS